MLTAQLAGIALFFVLLIAKRLFCRWRQRRREQKRLAEAIYRWFERRY